MGYFNSFSYFLSDIFNFNLEYFFVLTIYRYQTNFQFTLRQSTIQTSSCNKIHLYQSIFSYKFISSHFCIEFHFSAILQSHWAYNVYIFYDTYWYEKLNDWPNAIGCQKTNIILYDFLFGLYMWCFIFFLLAFFSIEAFYEKKTLKI